MTDHLEYCLNRPFSTPDRDNDGANKTNCAAQSTGGWWFFNCSPTNLNALNLDEIGSKSELSINGDVMFWKGFDDIVRVEMKIRPKIPN